ncbi:MAG: M12 family metallo-peptidase [Chloroflexota bacterium]
MALKNWGAQNVIILILLTAVCTYWSPTFAQEGSITLLEPVTKSRTANINTQSSKYKLVTFNPSYFQTRSSSKVIHLFDGRQIELADIDLSLSKSGITSMTAKAADYPQSEIIITWQGEIAAATINTGFELFRLRHIKEGVHALEQLPNQYLPAGEPLIPVLPNEARSASKTVSSASVSKPTGIDVMVLYTNAAEEAMGGEIGTQNTIQLALDESNLGFQNSDVHVRFELVYAHKVDLVEESFNFSDMLRMLSDKEDEQLNEIHHLRDYYGADVVTMIVDRPLLCGKTYQNQSSSFAFEQYAFSVLHYSCATGYYSFGHEIGHNLGSQHDTAHATQSGVFPHSHGYQDPASRFRTIMAYNCPNSCIRINQWSNPEVWYQDHGPTGYFASGERGSDNHLSLNQMAPIVASFRSRPLTIDQTIKINFQPAGLPNPLGYISDNGKIMQQQGKGLIYGWNHDYSETNKASDTPLAQLRPESTFIQSTEVNGDKAQWQIMLPNGDYNIRIVGINTENHLLEPAIIVEHNQFNLSKHQESLFVLEQAFLVSDGLLTVEAVNSDLTINAVEITALPLGSNTGSGPYATHQLTHTVLLPLVVR